MMNAARAAITAADPGSVWRTPIAMPNNLQEPTPLNTPPAEPTRTMAGDVQRILAEKKPSLLKQKPSPSASPRRIAAARWSQRKFTIAAGGLMVVIALLITAFVWRSKLPRLVENLPPPVPPPAAAFFFEATETILISSSSPPLATLFAQQSTVARAPGSFTRLAFEQERPRTDPAALSARAFFDAAGIEPPTGFLDAIEPLPQWFIYGQADGARPGMIFLVRNSSAAAGALTTWEATMRSDFSLLILAASEPANKSSPDTSSAPANLDDYEQVQLVEVMTRATTTTTKLVATSGTIVGTKAAPSYQLVLGDGRENYVLVTFPRASTDLFAPTFESLRIGDTVEVKGRANLIRGALVNSPNGMTIETIGVNLGRAPYFGAISLIAPPDAIATTSMPAPAPISPRFKSQSYRNIEFRFREAVAGQDRGIGYLYFPARRRIIMGTSTQSLRAAIDRLFV